MLHCTIFVDKILPVSQCHVSLQRHCPCLPWGAGSSASVDSFSHITRKCETHRPERPNKIRKIMLNNVGQFYLQVWLRNFITLKKHRVDLIYWVLKDFKYELTNIDSLSFNFNISDICGSLGALGAGVWFPSLLFRRSRNGRLGTSEPECRGVILLLHAYMCAYIYVYFFKYIYIYS
jgi:hypothetical protein